MTQDRRPSLIDLWLPRLFFWALCIDTAAFAAFLHNS